MRIKVINLRKLWLSLLLLVGATAIAIPGIQEISEGSNVAKIGSIEYETLQEAFFAANNGQTVTLLDDVDATGNMYTGDTRYNLWVKSDIMVDGNGHTLTVKGRGIGVKGASGNIDATFKNIIVKNVGNADGRCIDTRGNLNSLTLNNTTLTTAESSYTGYLQPLTIGGNQSTATTVTITNSNIITTDNAKKGYAITTFNPVEMKIDESTLKGWACLNIKAADNSAGSNGSKITVTNSTLVSANGTPGHTNSYSLIKIEDDNVNVDITGSTINVSGGDNTQSIVVFQKVVNPYPSPDNCTVTLGDDNNVTLEGIYNFSSVNEGSTSKLSISGGTFNADPSEYLTDGFKAVENNGTWTVQEKTYVAQIGSTKYETLAEAVAAVPADGSETTITMIADDAVAAEGKMTVAAGKNIVIDLNGKTISGSNNSTGNFYFIENKGTLEITDNSQDGEGKITFKSAKTDYSNERVTIYNLGGTLTLTKGTVENTTEGGLAYAINNSSNAWGSDVISTFNLAGGKISAPNGDAALRIYQNCSAGSTLSKNYVNITGGTVDATGIFVDENLYQPNASYTGDNIDTKINISGGTVNGLIDMKIRHPFNTLLNITGGDFTNTKMWVRKVANEYANVCGEPTAPMVVISGGKFEFAGDNTFGLAYDYASTTWTSYEKAYAISGGVFELPVDEINCAEGYIPATNTDEATKEAYPYTVSQRPYVAQISDKQYYSLADAVAAVPADGTETTITMIANEMINVTGYAVTIPATKNVVLDLNGYQVVGTVEQEGTSALIRNLGTLTIKDSSDTNKDGSGTGKLMSGASPTWTWDGTDDYTGSYASNLIRNEKNLIVESGNLYNMSTGSAAYAIDNYSAGNITINGGKVDAAKASAIRMFYVNGGSITVNDGIIGHYNSDDDCTYCGIQVMSGTKANVTITGGTIVGNYAVYANNTGGNISISGGTYDGYVGFAASVPNIEITDGAFNEWVGTWGDQTGFISGGIYASGVNAAYIADGFILTNNTNPETKDAYPYAVRQANYIAAIDETKYETLQAAINACEAGTETTIKLLDNVTDGAGFAIPDGVTNKNIIIDFDGKSYNVTKDAVGSSTTKTQAMHFYSGNTLTLKNGTITSAATSDENKLKMMMQNYCDLTLDGMTIDCSNVNGGTYENIYTGADAYWNNKSVPVFNFNTGNATIKNTTITFRDEDNMGLCVDGGTVALGEGTVVNGPVSAVTGTVTITDGKYSGAVTADQASLQISGGIFSEKPADEYCAEGYVVTDNTDEATKADYPFAVMTKEDAGIFVLIDRGNDPTTTPYTRTETVHAQQVTYIRKFSNTNLAPWYVPFDMEITEELASKFTFYRPDMVKGEVDENGVTTNDNNYLQIAEKGVGYVLKANKPYFIKTKQTGEFTFTVTDVDLEPAVTDPNVDCSTTSTTFKFNGNYNFYHNTGNFLMMRNNELQWSNNRYGVYTFRWYITTEGKDDWAKINLVIVEDDSEATGVSSVSEELSDEIEGYYSSNGSKHDTPVKGLNIIKYKNGKTKKIIIK